MSTPKKGDLARSLLHLIDTHRRHGSTTVLMESPKVKSGEAVVIGFSQESLNNMRADCPNLNGCTLSTLTKLRGTKSPVVIDLAAVYMALADALALPDAVEESKYKIVGQGSSRDIEEVRGLNNDLIDLRPTHGSEKAWVDIRLLDGTTHRAFVPVTNPTAKKA